MSRILLVYTGGTFGMMPSVPEDPGSPLIAASWEQVIAQEPALIEMLDGVEVRPLPCIDSSDMAPPYWLEIARVLAKAHDSYAGFVVIHGTDTMAYTASALSFLLPNLAKPVVLTGATHPVADKASDALDNLASALKVARPTGSGLPLVPEVTVCFGSLLLRGNRARKLSTKGKETFRSPNFPALGHVGACASINASLLWPAGTGTLSLQDRISTKVILLDLFPGMPSEFAREVLSIAGLSGVVLRTFGSGNAPTSREFLTCVEDASARGVVIANITQCVEGGVRMGNYASGAALESLGVVSAGDMTPEAALTKLQVLFGQEEAPDRVKQRFVENLRGERSY